MTVDPLDSVTCDRCGATCLYARKEDGQIIALDPRPEPRVILHRPRSWGLQFAYDVPAYRHHECLPDALPIRKRGRPPGHNPHLT